MIIFAAIFYLLLIILSVVFTKDKYNMFLISNVVFLTTTFLFPFLGLLFSLDVMMTVEGMTLYILYFLIFFVFYLLGRRSVNTYVFKPNLLENKHPYLYLIMGFSLFINIAFVLYSVASYGIQGAFVNSREIYTTTRTGNGQIYYIAALFLNIYALLGMFIFKRKWLHFLICVIFALPYGTKGKIFLILMYNFVYVFFVSKDKYRFRNLKYFIVIIIALPLLILGTFWYTSTGLDQLEVLKFAVAYGNEYENDFHDMIINFNRYFPHGYLHGQILFGDSFYPFIPRVLWAGKPHYFGDLYLSYIIYPEATLGDTGAPSFGPVGQPYADFGFWGALVQVFIEQSILGWFLGRYEIKCLKNPSIINFMLLITFSYTGLIVLAGTNRLLLMLINVSVLILLFWPLKYSIKFINNKITRAAPL
jgi:oligosaccharide repeat unit polymerase